eukprot:scaffold20698_cov111-Isochrysis_galbana.AAC.2
MAVGTWVRTTDRCVTVTETGTVCRPAKTMPTAEMSNIVGKERSRQILPSFGIAASRQVGDAFALTPLVDAHTHSLRPTHSKSLTDALAHSTLLPRPRTDASHAEEDPQFAVTARLDAAHPDTAPLHSSWFGVPDAGACPPAAGARWFGNESAKVRTMQNKAALLDLRLDVLTDVCT